MIPNAVRVPLRDTKSGNWLRKIEFAYGWRELFVPAFFSGIEIFILHENRSAQVSRDDLLSVADYFVLPQIFPTLILIVLFYQIYGFTIQANP